MRPIDLHVHSNKSDGSLTPSELVDYALEKNLAAFALTDHDTTEGLEEAIAYAKDKPIEIIPGIEFSTEYQGRDIHIVGLYIDYKHPEFLKQIKTFQDSRIHRNRKMCELLQKEGIDITYEKLLAENSESVITRSHYAAYLLSHGYIKNLKEAFERYIGDHAKCYVPREKITPAEAIALIKKVGGIPVLAHPVLYHMAHRQLDTLVASLKEAGLVAIEAVYSTYTPADERDIKRLAAKYDLKISGGSDFHGKAKPGLELGTGYGKLFVPEEILQKLKETKPVIFFSDMDGTLLNDEKVVTPKTKEALHRFMQQGNILALSSGRPLNSILEAIRTNDLFYENLYAIAYNGSLIYHCALKEKISEKVLNLSLLPKIQNLCRQRNVYCQTYNDTSILSPGPCKEVEYYTKTIHLPVQYVENFETLSTPPCKMLCIDLESPEKLKALAEELTKQFGDEISCLLSKPTLLEIFPATAGKGKAVHELCEILSIPLRHTYGAGDEQNDISMLDAVNNSIAMANATDIVKEHARYITASDNNHDGLASFLEDACHTKDF